VANKNINPLMVEATCSESRLFIKLNI